MWRANQPQTTNRQINPVVVIKNDIAPPIKLVSNISPTNLNSLQPLKRANLIKIVSSPSFEDALTEGITVIQEYAGVKNNTQESIAYVESVENSDLDYFSTADSINELSDLRELYIMSYIPHSYPYTVEVQHTCSDIENIDALRIYINTADKLFIKDEDILEPSQIEPVFLDTYSFGPSTEIITIHSSGPITDTHASVSVFNKVLNSVPTSVLLYPNTIPQWSGVELIELNNYICRRAFSLSDFINTNTKSFYIDSRYILANV